MDVNISFSRIREGEIAEKNIHGDIVKFQIIGVTPSVRVSKEHKANAIDELRSKVRTPILDNFTPLSRDEANER